MLMEVHIYSVKANSQAGNIWVKDIMTAARNRKNLCILQENSAGESAARVTYLSMRIHLKSCCVFPLNYVQLYLMVQGRVQLEHNSHIVKVSIKATCYHFKPWHILKETTKPACPFWTMPQEPWHPGKGAKPDCVIQLNCGEVRTHASYKTTRTWENFNNQGTKLILLSDKLWLIAHFISFY